VVVAAAAVVVVAAAIVVVVAAAVVVVVAAAVVVVVSATLVVVVSRGVPRQPEPRLCMVEVASLMILNVPWELNTLHRPIEPR
jgi:hypothetical protein